MNKGKAKVWLKIRKEERQAGRKAGRQEGLGLRPNAI